MATAGRETVAPGEIVASDWGNAVWDHTIQAFDSAAARDAQFPAPQVGAVVYLADVGRYQARTAAGSWRWFSPTMQGATYSFAADTSGGEVSQAITFTVGLFTVAPLVFASPTTGFVTTGALNITTAGFTLRAVYRNAAGAAANLPATAVRWFAVQI